MLVRSHGQQCFHLAYAICSQGEVHARSLCVNKTVMWARQCSEDCSCVHRRRVQNTVGSMRWCGQGLHAVSSRRQSAPVICANLQYELDRAARSSTSQHGKNPLRCTCMQICPLVAHCTLAAQCNCSSLHYDWLTTIACVGVVSAGYGAPGSGEARCRCHRSYRCRRRRCRCRCVAYWEAAVVVR